MKLIIDIPESLYRYIKPRYWDWSPRYDDVLCAAVQKGTVLPKGHGRLIDADELLSKHSDDITNWKEPYGVSNRNIIKAPTILEADKESTDDNT